MTDATRHYWNSVAARYFRQTVISLDDVHFGPLVPGDRVLHILPERLAGKDCLEIGCGGAQNAIAMARRGASCVAMDLSEAMLAQARRLCRRVGITVGLVQADMQHLPFPARPLFDVILSAYGVPFIEHGADAVREAARRLRPGGLLVISMAHPVFAGEWVELDDGRRGAFLHDYFRPFPDERTTRDRRGRAVCRAVPPAEVFQWLTGAGLQVVRFEEPRARERDFPDGPDPSPRVPYWSRQWLEFLPLAYRFPVVTVFAARKVP